jgi:choline dehydrogenase-like flavoprotein
MGAGIKHFDAIVIGSGMSGGWAAKELTQLGLKTLVMESGRDVKHLKDYPTMNTMPWQFEHRGTLPFDVKNQYKSFKNHYILTEEHVHFLKKDEEQEYIEDKPFDWLRGNQVGGRSLLWGRQTQRWSDFDFTGPARDGFAVDWPIRYKDIDPWYSPLTIHYSLFTTYSLFLLSIVIVIGPSLISPTFISAPNTPVDMVLPRSN